MQRVVVGHSLDQNGEATSLRLRHPASGQETLFLLTPPSRELLEINLLKNEHTSWFGGEGVVEGARRCCQLPASPSRPHQTAACTQPPLWT